ncbi:hypothetical protein DSO57_1002819 [Entomophthora muscae]|uniref:Uncharacterized protein n=1 Tax=Entomophthora muscae TaxID=34485 RepID=A0ACC2SAV9_9FUNG|nr:hypothetical protein DSO57_1002819 [Entomophthora muscae]
MKIYFLAPSILFSLCVAFGSQDAERRQLQLGENPAGFKYFLPEGAKWSGEGSFETEHYFPRGRSDEECATVNGTNYCIQELNRYLQVQSSGVEFPSHCWFADCNIQVSFPALEQPLVRMFDLTETPILDFRFLPFDYEKQCAGENATMLAPGRIYRDLELYYIFLAVELQIRISIYHQTSYVKVIKVPTMSVARNKACDAFISHRFD